MHLALELPGKGLVRSREGRHEQVAGAQLGADRNRRTRSLAIQRRRTGQSRRLQARGKPDCSAR